MKREATINNFTKGLIMDLNPMLTPKDTLVGALNATMSTNNGNEGSLLNDMGNTRVETAFLPSGYAPIGTCEYGGIIYIVSFNPITKRTQIGSFPSPENLFDSTELGVLSDRGVSEDSFIKLDNGRYTEAPADYTIVNHSKILEVSENKLNPGDKYIIYRDNPDLGQHVKDLGNNKESYIKISIVSVEDSGLITDLNAKEIYQQTEYDKDLYFILDDNVEGAKGKHTDDSLEEYRGAVDALTSNYLIFSSKIPGKLALRFLLIDLKTFDVGYYPVIDNNKKVFNIVWNFDWEGDGILHSVIVDDGTNINTFKLNNEDDDFKSANIVYNSDGNIKINKDLVVYNIDETEKSLDISDKQLHALSVPVCKYLELEVPVKSKIKEEEAEELEDTIKEFKIIPVLPYGRDDALAKTISINFSKLGTNEYNLTYWKYYKSDSSISIDFGLDLYPLLHYEVSDVTLEFYDTKGLAATYIINDRAGYSGSYSLQIPLDAQLPVPEMPGNKDEEAREDWGTIYSNICYLVKILVSTRAVVPESATTQDSAVVYSSELLLWTTGMYNDDYYSEKDFQHLNPHFGIDTNIQFSAGDDIKTEVHKDSDLSYIKRTNDLKVHGTLLHSIINNFGVFSLKDQSFGLYVYFYQDPNNYKSSDYSIIDEDGNSLIDAEINAKLNEDTITIEGFSEITKPLEEGDPGEIEFPIEVVGEDIEAEATSNLRTTMKGNTFSYNAHLEAYSPYKYKDTGKVKHIPVLEPLLKEGTLEAYGITQDGDVGKLKTVVWFKGDPGLSTLNKYGYDKYTFFLQDDDNYIAWHHKGPAGMTIYQSDDRSEIETYKEMNGNKKYGAYIKNILGANMCILLPANEWINDGKDHVRITEYNSETNTNDIISNKNGDNKWSETFRAVLGVTYGIDSLNISDLDEPDYGKYLAGEYKTEEKIYQSGYAVKVTQEDAGDAYLPPYLAIGFPDASGKLHLTNTFVPRGSLVSFVNSFAVMLANIYTVSKDSKESTVYKLVFVDDHTVEFLHYLITRTNQVDIECANASTILFGDVAYKDYFTELLNKKITTLDFSKLTKITFYPSMKVFPVQYQLEVAAPEHEGEYNVIVKLSPYDVIGDLETGIYSGKETARATADVVKNKLYMLNGEDVEEITDEFECRWGQYDFTTKKIWYAEGDDRIISCSNFGNIFTYKHGVLYLSNTKYDPSTDYFRFLTKYNNSHSTYHSGGWYDCRADETIIDGYEYEQLAREYKPEELSN